MRRRAFVGKGAAILATGLLPNAAWSVPKTSRSLNNIQVGVIGCNGMGWANTVSMLKNKDVNLVGICDVDQNVIDQRLSEYSAIRNNKPSTYTDYRELLDDGEIDAVIIGTPDHWHCKQMIDAVKAKKHVYVEKPVANTIEEAQLMVKAAQQYGAVVQTGQWQRSGPHYQKAMELLWSGELGKIRLVKVWAYQGWMKPIPVLPDSPVPQGVNYDMWLGMAPKRSFNANRFHFNFRWFWDYAGGLMTDWGVHEIDIALWGMNANLPHTISASGGKLAYPNDAAETPDTLQAVFEFDEFNMLWEHATGIDFGPYQMREGIAFIGNNGTLVVNRDGYEVLVEREALGYSKWGVPKMQSIESQQTPTGINYLDLHTKNFLEAVKANDTQHLNTPIQLGSLAAITAQMGNIAYRTGSKLRWDPSADQFQDNMQANQLMRANYENGWKLPTL